MSIVFRLKRAVKSLQWKVARLARSELIQSVSEARSHNQVDYNSAPRVAAVVQFFNQRANISRLWSMLSHPLIEEVIICEDGSSDGSIGEWVSRAVGKNHFVIRSNDIFEVRTYDRAISFARSEFILLLQDDEVPFDGDGGWLQRGLGLLARDPRLAVLGGRESGEIKRSHEGMLYEERLGNPFRGTLGWDYQMVVNRGPWIVRRSAVCAVHGIDQGFAPFHFDDFDLCLKLWLNGWRIALYDARFSRDVGVGGMRLFNPHLIDGKPNPRWEKARKNWRRIEARYGPSLERISMAIAEARSSRVDDGTA